MDKHTLHEIRDLIGFIRDTGARKKDPATAMDDTYTASMNVTTIDELAKKLDAEIDLANEPEFEGVPMNFGSKTLIIPPLNLRRLKRLMPIISTLKPNAPMTDEEAGNVVEIVHAAVSRNYPQMTKDDVEELIDLGNFVNLIKAIMGQSGLKAVKQGEVEARE